MKFEFNNTFLFGTENECIEVLETLYGGSPELLYIECIKIAEEYGVVLQSVRTAFLGEECEFSLCEDTGELKINVLA